MKILFIGTSSDYSLAHLKKLHQKENIVAIVEAAPRGANEQAERGKWWKSRLAIFAKLHHINYCYTAKLSSTESETFIRSTNCDLICIASCSQLIKENIISIPNYGVINSHDSLLPQYRGANPLYWTFYNWEKVGGNTIHYIDVGEDTGDILLQRSFDIPFGISYRKYRKKSMVNGALMMAEVVVQIKEGTVNPQKQVLTSPLRKGKRCSPEDYQIDWGSWEARRAYHFMRGTDYWAIVTPRSYRYYQATGISGKKPLHGHFIACKDGYVLLSNRLSFKRSIKGIAKLVLHPR